MARKKIDPKKIIRKYIKNFPKKIIVKGVLLFGSYATGKFNQYSDLDIVVISPYFKKMNFIKRMELLSYLRSGAAEDVPMDIIGYTPEEFKNIEDESIIMRRAKKEGKMINIA